VYLNPYQKSKEKHKENSENHRVIDRAELVQLSLFSER
jgi:hypothetical protein